MAKKQKAKSGANQAAKASAPGAGNGHGAGRGANIPADVRSFLYVGGRDCQVAHLREIASKHGAELIHHDGGLREAVSRIDTVLPSVDCVFCPIDCISHDACLRVKTGCKKFGVAFVPLRNGSKSSLERALQTMKDRNDERRTS
ncbi:DUF2325 domain-containing protein [Neorhizobium lilium]|uniref:DUF2325 domain-containing protein n=1 Tax=Neorhizobium lilium TaxID=2503024 RepID=A0A444LIK4_9HYPH|nr:DUF2325 domain-containing protein [Neorhizobium lilium]RWX78858.1 DUF2325 domain-containing protein [Neorhizobium lilium]